MLPKRGNQRERGNKSQEQVRCCWQHLQQQSPGATFSPDPPSGSKESQMLVVCSSCQHQYNFCFGSISMGMEAIPFLRKWYFNLVPHKHKWLLSCIKWRPLAFCLLVVTHLLLNSWCSPGGEGRVTGNNFMWSVELNYFSLETVVFLVVYMIIFVSFLVVPEPDTG